MAPIKRIYYMYKKCQYCITDIYRENPHTPLGRVKKCVCISLVQVVTLQESLYYIDKCRWVLFMGQVAGI